MDILKVRAGNVQYDVGRTGNLKKKMAAEFTLILILLQSEVKLIL